MILFTLRCASDHEFEAWFRDNAAYDRQHARKLITCPDCGSNEVEKAPMAPRVRRARPQAAPAPVPAPVHAPVHSKAGAKTASLPENAAQMRRMLQALRRQVETNCDYVGDRFADEARRIHRGEADARGIYGETSDQQASELADEGIEVARIPWVPTSDA
jgi:hypothetical protein